MNENDLNQAAETPGEELPENNEKQTPQPAEPAEEETEELRAELSRTRERVTQLERERILLGQGVTEDDLDYYVFKIGKLVSPEKDFDTAAKEFLKEHSAHTRGLTQRSTGASLTGRASRSQSTNDTMNRLLRGM